MKRRLLMGGLGFLFLSLRSFGSQFLPSQNKSVSVNLDTKANKILPVTVKGGTTYALPAHPVDGDKIQFTTEGISASSPAIIKHSGIKIVGELDDLEVDIPNSFTLMFSQKHGSWGIV